ncbi:BMP family ABC transporter substrate-binding protein [Aggregatilineales bacterium SYSU G02658]
MIRRVWMMGLMMLLGAVLFSPAQAQEEFIFGVVLVGPRNDGGWSQSHFEAAEYVEANLPGARKIVFESLNPADSPGVTLLDVVADMVDDGAKVIFTTSDSFEEDTNIVAEAFPDVVFINITGSNVLEGAPANVGNFNGMMEAPRLLAGCAAALATETGSIGYLGALINPETRRLAASSYLGARYCYENYRGLDPDALKFEIVWIGFWFNIPGVTLDPTEVATEFLNGGADVIISGIDTTESIAVAGQFAAQGQRTFAIPYGNAAGCSEAPNACIGVAYYNWGPAYLATALEVQAGTWEQTWDWLEPVWEEISPEGFYTGADTSIIGYLNGAGFPEERLPDLINFAEKMAEFMNSTEDEIFLWTGPLNYQDGSVLAEDGEPVELLDIWFLPQLLEGMLGASQ